MRIAGVHLFDGRAVWVDARDWALAPLDEADVGLPDGDAGGTVFVTPEQLFGSTDIAGTIIAARTRVRPDPACRDLPGADLPPLGTSMPVGGEVGTVTAIDAVHRIVRLTMPDGRELEQPA